MATTLFSPPSLGLTSRNLLTRTVSQGFKVLQDQVEMEEKLSIGAGKPFPPSLPDLDRYTVEFESIDDSLCPQNWSRFIKFGLVASAPWKNTIVLSLSYSSLHDRLLTSILVCSGTFIISVNSAISASGIDSASEAFAVGTEVGWPRHNSLCSWLCTRSFALGPDF